MKFESQPTLSGELIRLRPLAATDYEALYLAASDPLIWEQHPANRHEVTVFRPFFQETLDSGGALVALDVADDSVIGTSRFHAYNAEKSEVEIGWTFLARKYWGGTYNCELKQLMVQHALQFVDSVVFLVAPDNVRSQRAMEKIGGVREGMRADAYGNESYLYRIRREEL